MYIAVLLIISPYYNLLQLTIAEAVITRQRLGSFIL
jgi:hypothetical protein